MKQHPAMVGELIRDWRAMQRMGVRECAKDIGLSSATLNRIENGGAMDGRTMVKLFVWLFGGTP